MISAIISRSCGERKTGAADDDDDDDSWAAAATALGKSGASDDGDEADVDVDMCAVFFFFFFSTKINAFFLISGIQRGEEERERRSKPGWG